MRVRWWNQYCVLRRAADASVAVWRSSTQIHTCTFVRRRIKLDKRVLLAFLHPLHTIQRKAHLSQKDGEDDKEGRYQGLIAIFLCRMFLRAFSIRRHTCLRDSPCVSFAYVFFLPVLLASVCVLKHLRTRLVPKRRIKVKLKKVSNNPFDVVKWLSSRNSSWVERIRWWKRRRAPAIAKRRPILGNRGIVSN